MTATLILLAGLAGTPPSTDDPAPALGSVRASVQRALPLISGSMDEYPKHRDCFSCHHQAVPVLALATARDRGFTVDPDVIDATVEHTEADLRTALEDYRKNEGQGGGITRAGYALFTLQTGGMKGNEVTEAVAGFLLARDEDRDHWKTSSNRPPSEASEFTATYLAVRGMKAFGKPDQAERTEKRIASARTWLEAAQPKDTEDRVFRLFALKEAGAAEGILRKAAEDLIATRRDDGGWSQRDEGPSDAYATGSALVALHLAGGLATDDPVYAKGLSFLIGSQKDDGSWFVASRSKPFQPYFESGFPYGKDQFISMAASSWAATALTLACPKPAN